MLPTREGESRFGESILHLAPEVRTLERRFDDLLQACAVPDPAHARPEREILHDAHRVGVRLLEHHPHLLAQLLQLHVRVIDVLTIDQDGRTILPERLREHAGITGQITFVGLGEKFQLWEPKRFEAHLAEARDKVRDIRK